ncbi:MAG: hypothetical protein JWM21_4883 [Acidobacteria bacterium]|nr:hypothetical protein [Acidobacteriota bacterium]
MAIGVLRYNASNCSGVNIACRSITRLKQGENEMKPEKGQKSTLIRETPEQIHSY